MAYQLIKMFSRFICVIPQPVRIKLGNFIGGFTWLIIPAKRKAMAVENIMSSLACEEAEAKRIAECSWVRFGRMIMEVMAFPRMKQDITRYASIEGGHYLDEALSFGRGAIIATAHSGNWELLGGTLALHGYPLVAVAQKQTNADMDKLINEYRTLVGMHVTYKGSVREMIRLLGEGKIIGMLMDQDAGSDGVILDFLGKKASCPQGPAFLARMKESPVVPVFITENGDGTHRLLIKEYLWVEKSDDKQKDIQKATQTLTGIIEDHIRAYPKEWFWLHDRWKYTRNNHIE